MLKNKITKLENQLSHKQQKIGVWICPQDPPPDFDEDAPRVVIILPDESLTPEEIVLKNQYLAEYDKLKEGEEW